MTAELSFTIDNKTGELQMHIDGVVGPACEAFAAEAAALLGSPTSEMKTDAYFARERDQQRIRGRAG